jgi:hypothetical protein
VVPLYTVDECRGGLATTENAALDFGTDLRRQCGAFPKTSSRPLLNLLAVPALRSEKQSHPEGIMKGITISKLALAVVSVATVANSQTNSLAVSRGSISTWGVQTNTPQWNQDLGVTYTRQGCPDSPASCMSFTGRIAASDKVKVVLAIPLNSTTTAAYARQYSQLSLTSPFLAEISIDDFVDQYRALSKAIPSVNPAAVVAEVIANVKSANPKLAFGATIYENDLANSLLQNTTLPAATREKFDYIHLFIHYRENGPNYSTYVAQARAMFPQRPHHCRLLCCRPPGFPSLCSGGHGGMHGPAGLRPVHGIPENPSPGTANRSRGSHALVELARSAMLRVAPCPLRFGAEVTGEEQNFRR